MRLSTGSGTRGGPPDTPQSEPAQAGGPSSPLAVLGVDRREPGLGVRVRVREAVGTER